MVTRYPTGGRRDRWGGGVVWDFSTSDLVTSKYPFVHSKMETCHGEPAETSLSTGSFPSSYYRKRHCLHSSSTILEFQEPGNENIMTLIWWGPSGWSIVIESGSVMCPDVASPDIVQSIKFFQLPALAMLEYPTLFCFNLSNKIWNLHDRIWWSSVLWIIFTSWRLGIY